MKYLVSYCMYVFYNQSIYTVYSSVGFFHQMRQVSVFQNLYTYQRYFTRPVHRVWIFTEILIILFPKKINSSLSSRHLMIQFLHRSKNEFQNWIFVMKFPTISTWHLSNTIFHGKRRYCVSREISLPFYRGISEQLIPINAQIQCSKIDRLKAIECILWASKVEQNENNQMDIKKFQKSNKNILRISIPICNVCAPVIATKN